MKIFQKLAYILLFISFSAIALAGDKTIGENIDDTLIHTRVSAALVGHEALNINVEVHQGEVLLAGFVNDEASRESAVEAARSVEGVVNVKNHLYVRDTNRMAGETLDDNLIAGKIQAELAGNDTTSAIAIDVEVHEGKVLLSGYVDSEVEAETAIELARNIKGVTEVLNGMSVMSS